MYISVCIHICVHRYMYVCIYIYTHTYIYIYTFKDHPNLFKHKRQVTTYNIIKMHNIIPWKLHITVKEVLAGCSLNCHSSYSHSKISWDQW